MSRRWLATLALISALAVATPALMADHGWDRDKGEHGNKHFREDDHGRRGDRDDHRRHDRDGDRWERRGRYEYHTYDRDGRPPGWARGRRVGWGYCGLPPGQARKYGCWSYIYEGRRYYYYHDDGGRIIVRRPTIIVHAGVDIVQ
ncbi:MAG TPA: hypothetical protein VL155_16045 [Terriglobales bacterium]|jgi:hypothetical protein|nr:hypothetical protein [Terriglobales bacterium]